MKRLLLLPALVLGLATFSPTPASAQPTVEAFCPSWAIVQVCDKSGQNCSWMCII